ncbi:hypothetical protein WJM97_08750 [Okeanomitos corallinicola TIOX110]|uniref:Spore coat protein U domain-containing protein n=1 Tax=Okeanomitos corallinicola TIOX110 TaxID=3133117 RepID=A0ABZ2UWH4_9CYAN
MFYRLILNSTLALASVFTVQHTALAQSVDVPFNGTVPVQATFTETTPAYIEPTVSGNSDGMPTTLEPLTPATVNVQTSTNATITVSTPVLLSGASEDPPGTIKIGYVSFGGNTYSSDVGGGSAPLPAGTNDLQVSMLVERPTAFPAGTYTYTVTLTVTP